MTAAPTIGGAPTSPPTAPAPTATIGPSPTAPTLDFPIEIGFVNRFVMRVAVDDLNIRGTPSTKSISLGTAHQGDLYLVEDWPVQADGRTWYFGRRQDTASPGALPVLPAPYLQTPEGALSGWLAVGTLDNPFLVPVGSRCPTTVDLTNVVAMLDSELIDCFGSDTITVEGSFGCDACGGGMEGATFEPAWLAGQVQSDFLRVPGGDDALLLGLHFPPEGPTKPSVGASIEVHGHFSDARSSTCSMRIFDRGLQVDVQLDDAAAEQWCRGQFVVESYLGLG